MFAVITTFLITTAMATVVILFINYAHKKEIDILRRLHNIPVEEKKSTVEEKSSESWTSKQLTGFMPFDAHFNGAKLIAMSRKGRYYEVGKKYIASEDGHYSIPMTIEAGFSSHYPYNKNVTVMCRVSLLANKAPYKTRHGGEYVDTKEIEISKIITWDEIESVIKKTAHTNHFLTPREKQVRLKTSVLKGYKAMNKKSYSHDGKLHCNDNYPFEVGQDYTANGPILVCRNGFHFCTKLNDCFRYYDRMSETVICEIEASGVIVREEKQGDSKHAAQTIKVIREIPWDEIVKIEHEQLKEVEA